ncbi:transcription termination factor MTEF1, chloroplastic-like, partial [Camellia sinensis]|uniref:transcription termination factor MTEF1, chloroplastic-like n=1 Tax=Camellia sinensis TaxID=4442 RepID=UPI00103597A7
MIIPLQLLPPQTQTQTQTLALLPSLNPSPKPHPKTLLHCLTPLQTPSVLTPHLTFTTTTIATDSGLCFREKLLYLQTLKVNPSKALHKNPNFRSAPLDSLKSVKKCLYSMGIDRFALGRIFDMYPQLLTCDPYSDLYPVFDFLLNHVNIPFPDIRISIIRCPRLLICSVDHQLRPALRSRLAFWFFGFFGYFSLGLKAWFGNDFLVFLSFFVREE